MNRTVNLKSVSPRPRRSSRKQVMTLLAEIDAEEFDRLGEGCRH